MNFDKKKQLMIKGKKQKKRDDSENQFCMDEIVDSEDEKFQQPKPPQIIKKSTSNNQKISHEVNKNDNIQQKLASKGQKLTISQIKQCILSHLPEMKQQINEMDDQSLREIYEEVNQSIQKPDSEEERKINPQQDNQNYEEHKQSNNENQHSTNNKQRDPEIKFMLDEIIKSVPHMKDQVEIFQDNEIRELYQTVSEAQNSNGLSMDIHEVKKLLAQKIPEMKNELNYLSNEDILEVYQKYVDKQKTIQQNRPQSYPSQQRVYQQNQFSRSNVKPMTKDSWQDESIKKYPNNYKDTVKMEPRLGYSHNPAHQGQYGLFNNYKHGNGSQRGNYPILNGSNHSGFFNNAQLNNNFEVHTFHNNQKVSHFPYNNQNYARTVVIFHTMDPGYIPPAQKSKCRCSCCTKRQNRMNDENPLNSFIYDLMNKYSSKK